MSKRPTTSPFLFALFVAALAGCGGSSSDSITYETLNYPGAGAGSTTGITGIRGVSDSDDVYMTGSYYDGTSNTGTLYVGPVLGGGTYYEYLPASRPGVTIAGSNIYSADDGDLGNVKLVGTYTTEETGSRAFGFFYDGPIPDGGRAFWHPIDFPESQSAGPVLNTYPHSVMGDVIVGNYNTPISGGNAFLYVISSGRYVPLVKPGSRYNSAYGVWWNGGASYTIVGGYSDTEEDPVQLSNGFIVDYDIVTGELRNWTSLLAPDSVLTHFEGITSDGNAGYNLAGSWLDAGPVIVAGLVNLPRDSSGGFDPSQATWIPVQYPGSSVTTANTVFENYLLGVYDMPDGTQTNGFVATVPTSWY